MSVRSVNVDFNRDQHAVEGEPTSLCATVERVARNGLRGVSEIFACTLPFLFVGAVGLGGYGLMGLILGAGLGLPVSFSALALTWVKVVGVASLALGIIGFVDGVSRS